MAWGFMRLATFRFGRTLHKCIRKGITPFKIFIWGGISSDIYVRKSRTTKFPTVYPQMKISNTVIPNLSPHAASATCYQLIFESIGKERLGYLLLNATRIPPYTAISTLGNRGASTYFCSFTCTDPKGRTGDPDPPS